MANAFDLPMLNHFVQLYDVIDTMDRTYCVIFLSEKQNIILIMIALATERDHYQTKISSHSQTG